MAAISQISWWVYELDLNALEMQVVGHVMAAMTSHVTDGDRAPIPIALASDPNANEQPFSIPFVRYWELIDSLTRLLFIYLPASSSRVFIYSLFLNSAKLTRPFSISFHRLSWTFQRVNPYQFRPYFAIIMTWM